MTGALGFGSVGTAYAELHLRTDTADKDLNKALAQISKDADAMAKKSGTSYSDNFTKTVAKDLERKAGSEIGQAVTKAVNREKVKATVKVETDVDRNSLTRAIRSMGRTISTGIGRLFGRGSTNTGEGGGGGGIFSGIAGGFKSGFGAIGSSIGNVSSAGGLGPAVGIGVVALIMGIVGAVAALLNVLAPLAYAIFLLPAGVATLVAAILPLTFAFGGLAGAIAAVNSGDPEKIAEAFKNISPAAQQVAKDIAALMPYFHEVKLAIQEAFFAPLVQGNFVKGLKDALGSTIATGMIRVADSAGRFAESIVKVAENPVVAKFLDQLFITAAKLFDNTSGGFSQFLIGLSNLGIATLPYIDKLTAFLGDKLGQFGAWLTKISTDGAIDGFMSKLMEALDALEAIGSSTWNLLKAIVGGAGEDNRATEFLGLLIAVIDALTVFFKSDYGKYAMKGMVDMAELLLLVLEGVVVVFAVIASAVEAVRSLIGGIVDLIMWILDKLGIINGHNSVGAAVSNLGKQAAAMAAAKAAQKVNLAPPSSSKAYAAGGLIMAPVYGATIGESGPEAVIPLTDPGRAKQLMDISGLSALTNGTTTAPMDQGQQVITVNVTIGEHELNDIIDARVSKMLDRVGRSLANGVRAK